MITVAIWDIIFLLLVMWVIWKILPEDYTYEMGAIIGMIIEIVWVIIWVIIFIVNEHHINIHIT